MLFELRAAAPGLAAPSLDTTSFLRIEINKADVMRAMENIRSGPNTDVP
jgi:hypothetical protein